MSELLRSEAQDLAPQLVAWRRHFHAHPELSGREEQTAAFVAAELRRMGYQPEQRVGGTFGVTATLGAGSGGAIALRADMDALPVQEESGRQYASQTPGVMHACGHDAHMAMLLGAAQLIATRRNQLQRPVRLIFQPSEEVPPGGALAMINAGVLTDVSRVFGLHVWSEMPFGSLGTRVGPFMSSVADFRIVVTGKGGHAAMPQRCVDPVVIAAEVITSLQTVVSRSLALTDSAVVSVTRVTAGSANNVIASQAELGGTIRTLSDSVRGIVEVRMRALCEGIARAHGGSATLEVTTSYPVLVNDASSVAEALAAAAVVGFDRADILTLPPQGGGEDFAYYAQRVPAAFLFVGAGNESLGCAYPQHHARFDIDERALPLGAALLARLGLSGR